MEKRYKKLMDIEGTKWSKRCPIILLKGALIYDDIKSQNLLQLKFQSISREAIIGVDISYKAYSIGDELLLEGSYSYLDIDINLNDEFGEKTAIYLENRVARKFDFVLTKVYFLNGEVWENGEPLHDLEPQELLSVEMDDLFEQFQREYSKLVSVCGEKKYFPRISKDGWQCVCGKFNLETFNTCRGCGIKQEDLLKILDKTFLLEAKQKFETGEKKRCEEETFKNFQRKKKKRKIFLTVTVFGGIAVIIVLLFNFVYPYVKYSVAVEEFESGNYQKAVDAFCDLNNYKDSREKLIESEYSLACEKYNEKAYSEAKQLFSKIDSYKDSSEFLLKCENYIDYKKAKEFATKKDYKYAVELLKSLPGGFENSDALEKEYAILLAKAYLSEKNYDKAISICDWYHNYGDVYLEAYYQKAMMSKKKGKYDDAISFFEKCQQYRDSFKQISVCYEIREYQKALVYMDRGFLDKAIRIYKKIGNYKKAKKYRKLCEKNIHYAGIWKCLEYKASWSNAVAKNAKYENLKCRMRITWDGEVKMYFDDELVKLSGKIAKWDTNTFNLATGRRTNVFYDENGKKTGKIVYKYRVK